MKALKARVTVRGLGAIDKRTLAAQHLLTFRRELLDDLGGEAAVSAAQLALVEIATRTRLYLDHVDAHLLALASLLTRRNRLKPLVVERSRLADNLIAVLSRLGLERRKPAAPSLESYIAARYSRSDEIPNPAQDRRSAPPGGAEPDHETSAEPGAIAEPTQAVASPSPRDPASGARGHPSEQGEIDTCERAP